MKTISIIVTYNRKNLLEESINALKNQKNAQTDILVIDNCSTDGTEEMLKNKYNDIIYMNTGKNLGGAGGFNFGIKKAFELDEKYDYFWIMDDDTIPDDNCLEKLIDHAKKNPDFGFISPKTLWTDGSFCEMNRQSDFNNIYADENMKNGSELKRCTFVACFLNVNAILKVGLPIKEFFIWADDTEYTIRISKLFKSYYLSNCKVIHKMNNNNNVRIESDVEDRIDRYYYLYRNRMYIAKNDGFIEVLRYFYWHFKSFFRILFKSKTKKIKRICVIYKGLFSGIIFNPKIEMIGEK